MNSGNPPSAEPTVLTEGKVPVCTGTPLVTTEAICVKYCC